MLTSRFGMVGFCLWLIFAVLFFIRACIPGLAYAGGPIYESNDLVKVPIYKSRTMPIEKAAQRVSVGNPEIADILILKAHELYIVGKQLGTTNVMIWDGKDQLVDVVNLEITHDLNSLRQRLHMYLPDEDVGVHSSQGQLILSGRASSLSVMDQAVELARGYVVAADKEDSPSQIVNMLSVGGAQQVMMEVVVAEVSTELSRKFDANLQLVFDGSDAFGGIVKGQDVYSSLVNGLDGIFGSYMSGDMLLDFSLDIAKTNGMAKILAEPNITALSGQKAQFLSGGEFPIPVPSREGTTIEYRDFGVGVTFIPTVLDSGKINLNLKVLVSELSNANAVGIAPVGSTATLVIPSIIKRTSETTVELGDGQTIAIGGLLSDNLRERVNKIPGLGDVPILGQLFRSQEYVNGQSELVILVTPRLVRPFNKNGVPLPTDGFVAASDLEFYLLGKTTERKHNPSPYNPAQSDNTDLPLPGQQRGTEDNYGHEIMTLGDLK